MAREDQKILLAISGGLDSMVMATLFLNAGFPCAIAHCNYKLRGSESDGDEQFVRSWATTNKVRLHVKTMKQVRKGAVQLHARNDRYEWFGELMKEHGYYKTATAHHLNDSFETLLLNLVRGTGIKGLTGIDMVKGAIIRPLAHFSRSSLGRFAFEQGIEWREDSSNRSTKYDRNFIRHEIVPRLEQLNPSLIETYRHTRERLKMTEQVVLEAIERIRREYMKSQGGCRELKLDWVEGNRALLILNGILFEYGFNYTTVKEIFEALGSAGKQFPNDRYTLFVDRNSLFIKPAFTDDFQDVLVEGEGDWQVGSAIMNFSTSFATNATPDNDRDVAFLDYEKASFPFKVRKWKQGDRFHPLGMRGTKKVSDFFIDQKVPVAIKGEILVLEKVDTILWVVGYRMDDRFKLTSQSKQVLKVSFKH